MPNCVVHAVVELILRTKVVSIIAGVFYELLELCVKIADLLSISRNCGSISPLEGRV